MSIINELRNVFSEVRPILVSWRLFFAIGVLAMIPGLWLMTFGAPSFTLSGLAIFLFSAALTAVAGAKYMSSS